MNVNWEPVILTLKSDNKIRELYLRNVPVLRNCKNWNDVKEIGLIQHKTKYAYYNGLLVNYGSRLFYVSNEKIEALKPFRSWSKKKSITVIDVQK